MALSEAQNAGRDAIAEAMMAMAPMAPQAPSSPMGPTPAQVASAHAAMLGQSIDETIGPDLGWTAPYNSIQSPPQPVSMPQPFAMPPQAPMTPQEMLGYPVDTTPAVDPNSVTPTFSPMGYFGTTDDPGVESGYGTVGPAGMDVGDLGSGLGNLGGFGFGPNSTGPTGIGFGPGNVAGSDAGFGFGFGDVGGFGPGSVGTPGGYGFGPGGTPGGYGSMGGYGDAGSVAGGVGVGEGEGGDD